MTCDDLLAALNEHVDGTLDAAACPQLAEHLAGCNPCQVVVDNIRGTISLYKAAEPYPLPPEFQSRLDALLRTRWREKFGR